MLFVSQASTAVCVSMDIEASSSSSTIHLGGRAIDRHNPIICDGRLSGAPNSPNPYHQLKKGSSKSLTYDQKTTGSSSPSSSSSSVIARKSKKPAGSSRYLLGDTAVVLDGLSDNHHHDTVLALGNNKDQLQLVPGNQHLSKDSTTTTATTSSSHQSNKPTSSNQVVVLRVSLHCKGCEGKVRKHLSRMEGVTSFNIDFAAKKVTVVGDVSPVSVLATISEVKNAQILTTLDFDATTNNFTHLLNYVN